MLKTDMSGRTAVVTAGAGVVGAAICKVFAANGAKVAVCDKDEAAAKKVAAEINAAGGQAEGFALDIRKRETFKGVCDAILAKFGTIDFLINNESEEIAPEDRKPLHEFDMDLYDDIITANLDNVYYFSKAAMQDMAKRKKGAVVNVMSIRRPDSRCEPDAGRRCRCGAGRLHKDVGRRA